MKLYSAGKAAKIAGVNYHRLQDWLRSGAFDLGTPVGGGQKPRVVFNRFDLYRLRLARVLSDAGMPLAVAQRTINHMTPLDWGAPDHPAPFSLLCVIDFGPDTEGDRYGFLRLDTAQQLQALAKYPVAFIFNIQFIKTSIDAAAGGSRGES